MISVFCIDRCAAPAALKGACDDAFDTYADPRERAALERLPPGQARSAYRLSHGALRMAIRLATGMPPREILIEPSGKPFCPDGPEFNLSHSHDLTVVAVSSAGAVGIDVEYLDPDLEAAAPLSIGVASEDLALLPRLAKNPRQAETVLWSIKEAALKLTGDVMTSPQDIVIRQKGDVFEVHASRAARAPFPKVFARLIPLPNRYVVTLATYQAAPTFKVAKWHDELTTAFASNLD